MQTFSFPSGNAISISNRAVSATGNGKLLLSRSQPAIPRSNAATQVLIPRHIPQPCLDARRSKGIRPSAGQARVLSISPGSTSPWLKAPTTRTRCRPHDAASRSDRRRGGLSGRCSIAATGDGARHGCCTGGDARRTGLWHAVRSHHGARSRPCAGRAALSGAGRASAGVFEEAHLQSIPFDPVQADDGALAWAAAELRGRVLPSWLPLYRSGGDPRGGRWPVPAARLQQRPVYLRQGTRADTRRSGLRRLPHPLPAQSPGLFRRGLRVPGCELFPRGREGPGLRPVGPRTDDQDRRSRRRGIPHIPRLLAGTPDARRGRPGDLGTARQPEHDRRVPFCHPSGQGHRVRHRDVAVSTRRVEGSRHRAAHQHVLLRPRRSRPRRRLPSGGA